MVRLSIKSSKFILSFKLLLVVEIGLMESSYSVSESDGSVMVCFDTLSTSGDLECDVNVMLCTMDGSATS